MSDEADRRDLRKFCVEVATNTLLVDDLEGFPQVVIAAAIIENYITNGISSFVDAESVTATSKHNRH